MCVPFFLPCFFRLLDRQAGHTFHLIPCNYHMIRPLAIVIESISPSSLLSLTIVTPFINWCSRTFLVNRFWNENGSAVRTVWCAIYCTVCQVSAKWRGGGLIPAGNWLTFVSRRLPFNSASLHPALFFLLNVPESGL